jgi:formamidopyrimidine-DNA glycosylase
VPEAPELEVTKDFLNDRVVGDTIISGRVLKPSVVRPLAGDLASDVGGRAIEKVQRRGKFLVIALSGDRLLVIHAMLTGALQYCPSSERVLKRTCIVLSMSGGHDLRYLDDRQMGKVYYLRGNEVGQVPQLDTQGPDVLERIPFDEFQRRLAGFRGEIKGVLTRGRVISGIGNAYADEILFAAQIYPFRKRGLLSEAELRRLHESTRTVVEEAMAVLRERMGGSIHVKIRDFLKVHRKGGTPCPRCGGTISEITANRRITSYCRRCQPGLLVGNRLVAERRLDHPPDPLPGQEGGRDSI